ncbi:hypothetical protein C8R44DRAFT_732022 [Mycena epipterygia]|nr:hypothetical protein C8R44DRAFT_732022 [Mycena epipterygia]
MEEQDEGGRRRGNNYHTRRLDRKEQLIIGEVAAVDLDILVLINPATVRAAERGAAMLAESHSTDPGSAQLVAAVMKMLASVHHYPLSILLSTNHQIHGRVCTRPRTKNIPTRSPPPNGGEPGIGRGVSLPFHCPMRHITLPIKPIVRLRYQFIFTSPPCTIRIDAGRGGGGGGGGGGGRRRGGLWRTADFGGRRTAYATVWAHVDGSDG